MREGTNGIVRKRAEKGNMFALSPHKCPRLEFQKLQNRRNQVRGTSKPRRDKNARKRKTVLGCGPYKGAPSSIGKRFKIVEIKLGVLQNRDVTKTRGNEERLSAAFQTKIPQARFLNTSKHIEINIGVLRNQDVT